MVHEIKKNNHKLLKTKNSKMKNSKSKNVKEVYPKYSDNVITMTEFGNKAFIAYDKEKLIHILLADKIISEGNIYITHNFDKITHNLAFLSPNLRFNIQCNQRQIKNEGLDPINWFVIGNWICLLSSNLSKNGTIHVMQLINHNLDLRLLKKGGFLPVSDDILKHLQRIQTKLLARDLHDEPNQFVIKII